MSSQKLSKIGDAAFNRMDKVNGELFTLTYGSLVAGIIEDCKGDVPAIHRNLESIGTGMGLRIIDEFLARSSAPACSSWKETVDIIAKVGCKMFLGTGCPVVEVGSTPAGQPMAVLQVGELPLFDFVELPENLAPGLHYGQVLCGVLKGALEQVSYRIEAAYISDALLGDEHTRIQLTLLEKMEDPVPPGAE